MHLRDLTQFLTELKDNNTRPWFLWNKPRYDILRAEFLETVAELIKEIAKFDRQVAACDPKKAVFRFQRDTRFSHDKTPYKTHFSAGIAPGDKRRPSAAGGPTYYFHIEANGTLLFGAGEYLPPAPRLKAIREHVVNDATGFAKMLKNKHLRATYGDLNPEDKLQRPPKGFDANHPLVEYLKLKSYFVWIEQPVDINAPEKLVPQLAQGFKDATALVDWLRGVPQTFEEEQA
ncbi:DUF2461 domain-containing protein [Massilia norwichensis]|jgi:uncharacterized protein (TIGR02453 family)|uniref:DUF2461 domain-containing protein n=1 Tax=Massilia norwichensis TaxID=1442366 RepID=A0ABT2A9B6_9BURK|nr:DUF2461 domain-containing protein [Massilia norwichensis]MCS0590682.1 DUF2461 domain-containing protein [Massilia norwichensis]